MPVYFKQPKQQVVSRGNRGRHFDLAVVDLAPVIEQLWSAGVRNIRQMAGCLNAKALPAPSGGPFTYGATRRVLTRLRELHLGPGPRTLGQAARQRAPRPYQYRAGKPMKLSKPALKKALAQYGGE
jgi:hypothetical protein